MNPRSRRLRRLRRHARFRQAESEREASARYGALAARRVKLDAQKQDRLAQQAERKHDRLASRETALVSAGSRLTAMLAGIPKP